MHCDGLRLTLTIEINSSIAVNVHFIYHFVNWSDKTTTTCNQYHNFGLEIMICSTTPPTLPPPRPLPPDKNEGDFDVQLKMIDLFYVKQLCII